MSKPDQSTKRSCIKKTKGPPTPEVTTPEQALVCVAKLRRYLQQQQASDEIFESLNHVEGFIANKLLNRLDPKQMRITDFFSKK